MKLNFLIVSVILLALILGCKNSTNQSSQQNSPLSPNNRSNLQSLVKQKIGKTSPKWESIDFDKIEDSAITIHLNYSQMPSNMREVENDTKRIAQAVLDTLISQGYNPKDRWLALFVHAQRREKGATGGNMVRRFGKASYDFNSDRIDFSEAGSFY